MFRAVVYFNHTNGGGPGAHGGKKETARPRGRKIPEDSGKDGYNANGAGGTGTGSN